MPTTVRTTRGRREGRVMHCRAGCLENETAMSLRQSFLCAVILLLLVLANASTEGVEDSNRNVPNSTERENIPKCKDGRVLEDLRVALESRDILKIGNLLKEGPCLSLWDVFNASSSPLHFAAQRGSIMAVRLLVLHGAPLELQGKQADTPLHVAAQACKERVAKELLSLGASPNAEDTLGKTPLHYATECSSPEVVRSLISHGAHIDPVDMNGKTPLFYALEFGGLVTFDDLLSHGANPNATDITGRTILLELVNKKLPKQIRTLFSNGAFIEPVDKKGRTPLFYALEDQPTFSALLELGANVNATDYSGLSILHEAVYKRTLSRFTQHEVYQGYGYRNQAVFQDVQDLLQRKACLDCQDENGWTPLHIAVFKENPNLNNRVIDLTKTLVEAGASVNKKDIYGFTPLEYARARDDDSVAKYLESKGGLVYTSVPRPIPCQPPANSKV